MTLKLISPHNRRERILVFGPSGVGKSETGISCLQFSPSSSHAYVIDNNNAWEVIADDVPDEVRERLHIYNVTVNDWQEHTSALQEIRSKIKPDDFLFNDEITPTYNAAQRHFSMHAYGKDIDDLFLDIQTKAILYKSTAGKRGVEPEGEKDTSYGGFSGKEWNTITRIYLEQYLNVIVNWPSHIVSMADIDPVKKPDPTKGVKGDDKNILNTFGAIGFKPKGQGRVPNVHHTILLLSKERHGEYKMKMAKDRRRELVWEEKYGGNSATVGEFGKSYLSGIAKWKWVKDE